MSRNSHRTGAPKQKTETPSAPQQGSFFSFPEPTELVDLPSKGLLYPEGHPFHGKEYVEIGYMTTAHEEILINQSFIKKGIVLDRLISALLKEKVDVDSLYTCDKTALLVAARKSGYGKDFKANVKCPECGAMSPYDFDLSLVEPKEAPEELKISSDGTFEVPLHQVPGKVDSPLLYIVEVRMLKGGDEKRIRETTDKKTKLKLEETPLLDLLREIIVAVRNPAGAEGSVEEFLEQAPTMYTRHVRNEYQRLCPNLDLDFEFECPKCSAETIVKLPMTAKFFWPDT